MTGPKATSLSDLGVAVLDCEHKTPPAKTDGHPYIAIPNIVGGRVDLSDVRRISDDDLAEWTRRTTPRPGDVIVTRRGRVGDTAPVPQGLACAIGQNLVLLRADGHQIDQGFLLWATRSPQWLAEVNRLLNVGAVFSSLNVRDIARIELLAPSIREQRAIAEVLGALDDKIAASTLLASTAHDLAEELYSRAVNSLPKVRMSEQLESVLGGTPKRSEDRYWNGDIPWASAKDVASADFGVVLGTSESITSDATQESKAKPLPAGSVILTARGTVGAVARLGVAAAINQSCYGFVPGVLPKSVLYFAVRSIADQTRSLAHGSVFDTITRRTFDFVEMPDGKSSAIAPLELELAKVLELSEARMRENAALAETRDALLPLLMSGKVTVRDAESVVEGVV